MIDNKKDSEKIQSYSVKVFCRNCGQGDLKMTKDGEFFSDSFVVNIPLGTLLREAECPYCKCKKLSLKTE